MKKLSGKMGRIAQVLTVALLLMPGFGAAEPLFEYDGVKYQASDLPNKFRQRHYEIELESYRMQQQLADVALFNIYLKQEAKSRNLPLEQVEAEALSVRYPGEDTVQLFYEQNRQQIDQPLEQVRQQIVQYLLGQKVEQKRNAIVEQMKRNAKYRLLLQEPIAPVLDIATEGYPVKGNPEAKVTLVEFADYQCPHCRKVSGELKKLMARYGDQVKLVFRDFPINRSGISLRVAQGAVCADAQGKFWEYHDMAFELQSGLSMESPLEIADALGLEKQAFESCLTEEATLAKVAASKAEAEQLNIRATPTIYINGRFVYDHDRNVDLASEIEKAIEAVAD